MEHLDVYIQHSLIEDRIEKQLEAIKRDLYFAVYKEYAYPNNQGHADFLLYFSAQCAIAMEVKVILTEHNIKRALNQLQKSRLTFNASYGIVTNGEEYQLYDIIHENLIESSHDVSEIIQKYLKSPIIDNDEAVVKDVCNDLAALICEKFKGYGIEEDWCNANKVIVESNTIKIDPKIELKLFSALVHPINKGQQVCRYTSANSLFMMLDKNTYRMYATDGMNDREEGEYFWEGVYSGIDPKKTAFISGRKKSIFIMSCTNIDLKDDLVMWRLYGGDAKGVCLISSFLGEDSGFYFREVNYGTDVLTIFNSIAKYLYDKYKLLFVFNYVELWSAFFKSKKFAYEKEIRLVYLPNENDDSKQNWIISDSNQILNQYMDFEYNGTSSFPLVLESILFGVAFPERDINMLQYDKLVKESNFKKDGLSVLPSEIKSYRPSK